MRIGSPAYGPTPRRARVQLFVLGLAAIGHFPVAIRVMLSRDLDLHDERAIDWFFGELGPDTVAVMIHSKNGIEPASYRTQLERLWTRVS